MAASESVMSSAMRQFRDFRRVRPMARLMFSTCGSTGISSRAGDTEVQSPKSGRPARTIARRVEAGDELRRRWAHLVEHALELPAEEIDASIGQTRGQQRDDFSVARIRITERKSDGVALDPGGVVEVAVELLERFAQCAGSSHSPLTRMITCSAVAKLRDVGVCGLGVIGRAVCRALDRGIPRLGLGGAMTRSRAAGEAFLATLQSAPPFLPLEDLIATCDLIVEASTQSHLAEIAPKVLQGGRDLVVLSAGGLLGRGDWVALAEANR